MFDFLPRLIRRPIDKSRPDNSAGFTVIEVIAALAILSLALAVLLATLSDGFYNQGKARSLAEATSLAQSLLARAGTEFPLQSGSRSGEERNGLHWRLSIMPYGTPADRNGWPVAAYEIAAEIFADVQSKEPIFVLKTLRLGAKASNR